MAPQFWQGWDQSRRDQNRHDSATTLPHRLASILRPQSFGWGWQWRRQQKMMVQKQSTAKYFSLGSPWVDRWFKGGNYLPFVGKSVFKVGQVEGTVKRIFESFGCGYKAENLRSRSRSHGAGGIRKNRKDTALYGWREQEYNQGHQNKHHYITYRSKCECDYS